jgi:hypothetical protein
MFIACWFVCLQFGFLFCFFGLYACFYATDCYSDYYNFVVHFEIRYYNDSGFFFFLMLSLSIFIGSIIQILGILSSCMKKWNLYFDWYCIESVDHFEDHGHFSNIYYLNPFVGCLSIFLVLFNFSTNVL